MSSPLSEDTSYKPFTVEYTIVGPDGELDAVECTEADWILLQCNCCRYGELLEPHHPIEHEPYEVDRRGLAEAIVAAELQYLSSQETAAERLVDTEGSRRFWPVSLRPATASEIVEIEADPELRVVRKKPAKAKPKTAKKPAAKKPGRKR